MKLLSALLIALIFFLNVSASANQSSIRFGVLSFYPPFVSRNSLNQSYGFDIAVAQAVCKQLHKACVFVPMSFKNLFTSLDNNSVDAVMSAILITPERTAKYEMTIPYYKGEMSFLTTMNKNVTISKEGLADKKVGTIKGTIFVDYIAKTYPGVDLHLFETVDSTIYNLSNGNVDVILLDSPNARWWVLNGNNQFKIAGENIPISGYGIALKKGNIRLLNQLNFALKTIIANGTMQQIINNYLLFSQ